MAKTFNLDEMREIIGEFNPDAAALMGAMMEAIGDQMAAMICEKFELTTGGCEALEPAFAGTCASFYLTRPGQSVPEIFDCFDPDEPITLAEEA